MAEPVIQANRGENEEDSGTNQAVVNMPSTRPDGDLYFMLYSHDGDSAPSLTGWNQLASAEHSGGGSAATIGVWWRYGSSEPATYTVTHSGGTEKFSAVVVRITGAHASDPIGASSSTSEGNSSTATAPAITAEEGDSLILRCYTADNQDFTGYGSATEVWSSNRTDSDAAHVGLTQESSPGASTSTGTDTGTLDGSNEWITFTVEILAAAAAGGTGAKNPFNPRNPLIGVVG